MPTINEERLFALRQQTHHLTPGGHLRGIEEAIDYVNQRGFIFFWPISGIDLPSLWVAVAGDRPVADAHDDPGHVSWGWKDSLLGTRSWFYAKALRKRATIISMQVVPYFYALSDNYGSPEDDYLIQYEQGLMTLEARAIYEAILKDGPLDTIALRKAARLSSRESESRFNKAITDLQADFKIVPTAVTQAGAWRYAFAYDLVSRHYPEIAEQARFIGELDARRKLVEMYINSVGACQFSGISRLFSWKIDEVQRELTYLAAQDKIFWDLERPAHPGKWVALSSLCE